MKKVTHKRYGIGDIVINANESDELSKWLQIRSEKDGDIIGETDIYWICDYTLDEDGNYVEIEEDEGAKDGNSGNFGGDTGIDADFKFLDLDNPGEMLRWEKRINEPWGITDGMPRCPYNYEDENCSCPKFQATAGDIDEPFSYCDFVAIENSKGWCEVGIKSNNEKE
tara:strand:- start:2 stop:505 length:504 start_codon:yes stop_codon:yes gene_type:complete